MKIWHCDTPPICMMVTVQHEHDRNIYIKTDNKYMIKYNENRYKYKYKYKYNNNNHNNNNHIMEINQTYTQ